MEDLASKLSEILESPEGMDKVRSLAGALLGGSETTEKGSSMVGDDLSGLLSSVSPREIQAIIKVSKALKSGESDDRSRLLLALKPHLTESRRDRVDQAVKILKIINILPIVQEQGLF